MSPPFRRVVLILVGLLATACGESLGPIRDLPRPLSIAEQRLVDADNRFAFNLFQEIRNLSNPDSNIFVSPLSVAMALGMTYNGARGATRDSMQLALELAGMDIQQVNEAYGSLIDLLRNLDPSVEFRIANSIWYRQGLPVRQEFIDLNRQYFDAEIAALDFSAADAAPIINDWVNQNTNGRITKIVDAPIDPQLVMFLINAIYFKGSWTYQFDKSLTAASPFSRADGSQVTVDLMAHQQAIPIQYHFDNGVEIADLSYGGGPFRMTIVLPPNAQSLDSLLGTLTRERWNTWVAALDSTSRYVLLPRFTLEYALEMEDVLSALGMGIAFDARTADLSGIAGTPGDLFISRVKHKTFLDVNEEGTEAAAVTSVEIGIVSLPPRFVVDRPFFFMIRESLSGTILFMGRIMDP